NPNKAEAQTQFSPENPYISEIIQEKTNEINTETQIISQSPIETTSSETSQTEEHELTDTKTETNKMETTENEPEAADISANNATTTDIEIKIISNNEKNNKDEREFTLVISRKGKYKNKVKKASFSPLTRVNKVNKENNSQEITSP
ncbi:10602_t:CDS:1, partial [Racocetra persica]